MNKRTKALSISPSVRKVVMERDEGRCIVCGSTYSPTLAHYKNRGSGGLGIEQNLVVLCLQHHFDTDQTIHRKRYLELIKGYLKQKYPDWNEDKLKYGFDK